MNILDMINEEMNGILNENVAMAEKILKSQNIPLDNPYYVNLKKTLTSNNNIGYLGIITKLSTKFTTKTYDGLQDALRLYDYIIENKNVLQLLPKQLYDYEDANELHRDISNASVKAEFKKLANKITNKTIKTDIVDNSIKYGEWGGLMDSVKYFNKIESSDQKEFLVMTDKYKNTDEFFDDLLSFIREYQVGFNYKTVLNKISGMSDDDINLLFSNPEKKYILARIIRFSAAEELGSKSWCIVGSEENFLRYTKHGANYQYFFFNFDENIPKNERMIGFTMNDKNDITDSHDRYNEKFNNPIQYLQNIGIASKIFLINSRERAKSKVNATSNEDGDLIKVKINSRDGVILGDKYFGKIPAFEFKLMKMFISILRNKLFKFSDNLDLVFKKFQDYDVEINNYDTKTGKSNVDKKYINVVEDTLHYIEEIIKVSDYFGTLKIDDLVKLIEKVYSSNIGLKQSTRYHMAHFLKDHGVDILSVTAQKKSKHDKDLTDMEFAMLKNRGEDMKPLIQNKIAGLRRGENVNMSTTEINFAIDNGYKNVVAKYYRDALPHFAENQLDYDDLNIYKKLGMLDDVTKIIVGKGNMFGIDSLNSIERSVYDMNKGIK